MAHKAHSRHTFKCVVDDCGKEFRSDKLRYHYQTNAVFDKIGKPIAPDSIHFNNLRESQKLHTRHFYLNGFTESNLPSNKKRLNVPANPWDAIKKSKKTNLQSSFDEFQADTDIEVPISTIKSDGGNKTNNWSSESQSLKLKEENLNSVPHSNHEDLDSEPPSKKSNCLRNQILLN